MSMGTEAAQQAADPNVWGIIASVAVVGSIVLAAVAWVVRTLSASTVSASALATAEKRISDMEKVHADFREKVATEYATMALLKDMEGRIMHQLDRIYSVVQQGPK